jgi:hypothetical protein
MRNDLAHGDNDDVTLVARAYTKAGAAVKHEKLETLAAAAGAPELRASIIRQLGYETGDST